MSATDAALITVASVQGAATLALVGVTFWYAKTSRSIAKAAKEQAEASVKIAEEMREQRMSEDEPWLVIDVTDQKLADYHEWDEQSNTLRHKRTGKEVKPWPLPECTVSVHNDGRRAAINMEICYLQAQNHYLHSPRRSLLHGKACVVDVTGFPAPYGQRPAWQELLLKRLNVATPGCVIARYEDVHGRSWVSYLDLDWDPGMTPHIVPLKQGRLRLDEHP